MGLPRAFLRFVLCPFLDFGILIFDTCLPKKLFEFFVTLGKVNSIMFLLVVVVLTAMDLPFCVPIHRITRIKYFQTVVW